MIEGLEIKKLKVNYDERGHLMEILRRDDKIFKKFGQVYITTVKKDIIKAWHYHKLQDDYFCCIYGKILLAVYDARKNSKTFGKLSKWVLSLENPKLIKIPALVYHGFKGLSEEEAIVINIPTKPYNRKNPDEYRVNPFDKNINFNWKT